MARNVKLDLQNLKSKTPETQSLRTKIVIGGNAPDLRALVSRKQSVIEAGNF